MSDYGKFNTPLGKWRKRGPSGNATGTDYDRLYRAITGKSLDSATVRGCYWVNDAEADEILSNFCDAPESNEPVDLSTLKAAVEAISQFLFTQGGAK
jgi:hypothetical protein